MEVTAKLAILADAAKYDASCASSGSTHRNSRTGGLGSTSGTGICHSYTPDGRCVSLLKILLTNHCVYDCLYCVNRRSSNVPRARFTVKEVVQLTLSFYRRNYIEGLFLSSGIIQNPDYTMERLVEIARQLRVDHQFRGYLHLKTIPEANPALVEAAGHWADRISINVELPEQSDLDRLAPEKSLRNIEDAMLRIKARVSAGKPGRRHPGRALPPAFAPAGQSTQMVVGATPASDAVILKRASHLYRTCDLRRVYYSAFSPIPDASARLPLSPPPLIREHRLYQADWLFRFYGFAVEELTANPAGNLALAVDPKMAWALRNPGWFPVNLNTAPRDRLLRVPGLGVRNVNRLVQARRWHRVRTVDLTRLRIPLSTILPFVETEDHHPKEAGRWSPPGRLRGTHRQLDLFASGSGTLDPR